MLSQRNALPADLRRRNIALILETLAAAGPLSRADLARRTAISSTSISKLVSALLRAGVVEQESSSLSQGLGRPAQRLRLRDARQLVVGADLGASNTRLLVADVSGAVVAQDTFETDCAATAPLLLRAIGERLQALLARHNLPFGAVHLMGLGVPCSIDPASGRLWRAEILPALQGAMIHELLARAFPFPTLPNRDTNLAVIGEHRFGAAQGYRHVFLLSVGTGIGGGVLINGSLHEGAHGNAGDIGYLRLLDLADGASPPPILEAVAAGPALAARAQARVPGRAHGANGQDYRSSREVFSAAREGDPVAMAVVDEAARYLAGALAAAVSLYDPELLVLTGGLGQPESPLLEHMDRWLDRLCDRRPPLVAGTLAHMAVAYGGVAVALDHLRHVALRAGLELEPDGASASAALATTIGGSLVAVQREGRNGTRTRDGEGRNQDDAPGQDHGRARSRRAMPMR